MKQKNEVMPFIYILFFVLGASLFVYDIKNMGFFGNLASVTTAIWLFIFIIAKGWQMRTVLSSCFVLGYLSPMTLSLMLKAIRNSYGFEWMIQTSLSATEASLSHGYVTLIILSLIQLSINWFFKRFKGKTTFKAS